MGIPVTPPHTTAYSRPLLTPVVAGMERRERLEKLVDRVVAEKRLWALYYPRTNPHIDRIVELAVKLRVPAREDCIANFIAAYMVVKGLMPPSLADKAAASSAKGRRHWQKKLAQLDPPLTSKRYSRVG